MKKILILSTISALTLAACGGGGGSSDDDNSNNVTPTPTQTPVVNGVTVKDATYTMKDGDAVTVANAVGFITPNQPYFVDGSVDVDGKPGTAAAIYGANSDFLGMASANLADTFAAYSGTKTTPSKKTGTAVYSGKTMHVKNGKTTNGDLTLSVDHSAKTFTGNSGAMLTMNGSIDGANLVGTSDSYGDAGIVDGGFYANGAEANGVYKSNTGGYSGVFQTSK